MWSLVFVAPFQCQSHLVGVPERRERVNGVATEELCLRVEVVDLRNVGPLGVGAPHGLEDRAVEAIAVCRLVVRPLVRDLDSGLREPSRLRA